jgi:hypothetical protein
LDALVSSAKNGLYPIVRNPTEIPIEQAHGKEILGAPPNYPDQSAGGTEKTSRAEHLYKEGALVRSSP